MKKWQKWSKMSGRRKSKSKDLLFCCKRRQGAGVFASRFTPFATLPRRRLCRGSRRPVRTAHSNIASPAHSLNFLFQHNISAHNIKIRKSLKFVIGSLDCENTWIHIFNSCGQVFNSFSSTIYFHLNVLPFEHSYFRFNFVQAIYNFSHKNLLNPIFPKNKKLKQKCSNFDFVQVYYNV